MTTLPNSGLVISAWVKGIAASGPFDPSRVAMTLPADDAPLVLGFCQLAVTGGSPDIDVPVRRAAVAVDFWAAAANGGKPPWGRAWAGAEVVRAATEGTFSWRRPVTMPSGYSGARLMTVYVTGEPAPVFSDPGRYARVRFTLQLDWSPA